MLVKSSLYRCNINAETIKITVKRRNNIIKGIKAVTIKVRSLNIITTETINS